MSMKKGKEQPNWRIYFAPGLVEKTGAPAKTFLWGYSTVGLSHEAEPIL